MLTYNTQLKRLILPEYGRNIQNMVDHCLTLDDKAQRTACAQSIVRAMGTLFPALKGNQQEAHKLWDHLAIMSDFKLDIDWPCEVVQPDNLQTRPDKVPYTGHHIRYRHYGRDVEEMIAAAVRMEDSAEKDALIILLANHMKKLMLAVNKDGVDDVKVFKDLAEYSHGAIMLDPSQIRLNEYQAAPEPEKKSKRKRRK